MGGGAAVEGAFGFVAPVEIVREIEEQRRVRGEQLGVNRREQEALPPRDASEVGEVLERRGEQFFQPVRPRVEDVRPRLHHEGAAEDGMVPHHLAVALSNRRRHLFGRQPRERQEERDDRARDAGAEPDEDAEHRPAHLRRRRPGGRFDLRCASYAGAHKTFV